MRGRIQRIAYIGWKGIEYDEISLNSGVFTGLTGPTGAGKSTLLLGLSRALLPDRNYTIKAISNMQDASQSQKDDIDGRIGETGQAYTILDIRTRHGTRLIAGVSLVAGGGEGAITPFYLTGYPEDRPLQDAFRLMDANGQETYPSDPRKLYPLAAAGGYDLHICATQNEYGQVLYDAGVSPTDLSTPASRSLYARILETTYRGDMLLKTNDLKDYLLPAQNALQKTTEEITNQIRDISRTKRQIGDAVQNLKQLEGVQEYGETLIVEALRYAAYEYHRKSAEWSTAKERRDVLAGEIQELVRRQTDTGRDIAQLWETIKTFNASKNALLAPYEEALQKAETDLREAEGDVKRIRQHQEQYRLGEQAWRTAVGETGCTTIEDLTSWFHKASREAHSEAARLATEVQRLKNEMARLSAHGASSIEPLAKALHGVTLAESCENVTWEEAQAIELGIGGSPHGVVCQDIDALQSVVPHPDWPKHFWVGTTSPLPPDTRTLGGWRAVPLGEGYLVGWAQEPPTLGSAARKARLEYVNQDLVSAQHKKQTADAHLQALENREHSFHEHKQNITFYLTVSARGEDLSQTLMQAQLIEQQAIHNKEACRQARRDQEQKFQDDQERHNAYMAELSGRNGSLSEQIRSQKASMGKLEGFLKEQESELQKMSAHMASAQETLGEHWNHLRSPAIEEPKSFFDTNVYTKNQMERVVKLREMMVSEPEEYRSILADVDPKDVQSCARIWTPLLAIIRKHIPLDLMDKTLKEALIQMREDRLSMNQTLEEQIQNAQLPGIAEGLGLLINTHRRRIQDLSRIGESLQFGNVEAVRIGVTVDENLFNLLRDGTQPGKYDDLFSGHNGQSIEEILSNFFAQMDVGNRLTGKAILDYRSYMTLTVEIRRRGKGWEPAMSTSGGESIGCAVAIALMLSRSMSSNVSGVREDQITPIFLIDEMHRMDAKGRAAIVDMAKREHFHIIAAAPTDLSPDGDCTIYCLNHRSGKDDRSHTSIHEVVMRALTQTGAAAVA